MSFFQHSDEESRDKGGMDDKGSELSPPSGEQKSTSKRDSLKKGKRRVKALDDSDEEDTGNVLQNEDAESGESGDDERAGKEKTDATTEATTLDSDDDDNLEYSRNISDTEHNNADKSQSEAGKKRPRDDNDDDSSDDDDEEFNLPLNFHKKARRVLVDDDEDED